MEIKNESVFNVKDSNSNFLFIPLHDEHILQRKSIVKMFLNNFKEPI